MREVVGTCRGVRLGGEKWVSGGVIYTHLI